MESSKIYYYAFKYVLILVGAVLAMMSVISWIAPQKLIVNNQPGTQDITTTAVLGLLAILAILIFVLIKDRFAIVELGNQNIKIKTGTDIKTVSWLDVEKIDLIQFVYPPLYSLTIKDSNEAIWFNTLPQYFSINGFILDNSEMGDLIKKKKKELGI